MTTSLQNRDESESSVVKNDKILTKPNLKGDWMNFFLLLLLYLMQGLPMGISSAIPLILKSKENSSYSDQAIFSITGWPFSLKLLWAPLVDALYFQKLGRRKSWLVPVQYLIGVILLFTASHIDDLIPEDGNPNVVILTYVFLTMNFLAATQDIAVDGWALTLLKKHNVGYASTCNSTGQLVGIMMGSVTTILFTSEEFCNKYLRFTPDTGGIVTMKSLLHIWGISFITVTTLILIIKKEKDYELETNHVKLDVIQNYVLLWDIFKLPSIRLLSLALVTAKIGFAATENVSTLNLIDAGVPKDDITVLKTLLSVMNMIIPLIIAKYSSGPKPWSIYLKLTPIRLLWDITFVFLIYYTPSMIKVDGVVNIPMYYYAMLIFIYSIKEILANSMFVCMLAFFARISDSHFGGTYMTLLNTVTNIGYLWSSSIALAMIDILTFERCSFNSTNDCSTTDIENTCKSKSNCTKVNGFYVEIALCTIIGLIWYCVFKNTLKNFQKKSLTYWIINKENLTTENDKNAYSMTIT